MRPVSSGTPKREASKDGCGRGSTPMESHFGVDEFTTHVRTYFSGWIGMCAGGTGF